MNPTRNAECGTGTETGTGNDSAIRVPSSALPPDPAVWQPSPEQVAQNTREQTARSLAHATPLPGPLREAFAAKPPKIGRLQLRDITLDDLLWLEDLEHPMAKFIPGIVAGEVKEPPMSLPQIREVLFLWSQPPDAIEKLMDTGPDAFRAAARKVRLGASVGLMDPKLGEALGQLIARAFSTLVQHGPDKEGGTFPPPPASPMTASAGASKSSAP